MADYCAFEYVGWELPTQVENRSARLIEGGEYIQALGTEAAREWRGFRVLKTEIELWLNRHFDIVTTGNYQARDYAGYFVRRGAIRRIQSYGIHSPWVDIEAIATKKL